MIDIYGHKIMLDIPGLVINNGWKPCFPGGDDTPDDGDCVLALFYVHISINDSLTMDPVIYQNDDAGGRYWSNTHRCNVHPLCWHPLPDLPAFITGPDKDEPDYIPFNGTD